MEPRVALVAGEASGDLLAGLLLGGMRQRWPGLQAAGIGGPRMAENGFQAWWPHDKLSVRGYVEVLRHYREIVGIRRQLRERLLRERPQLFIGVDAPDFNLDLEVDLRAAGLRTVHFVCPSIWAWRPERIEKIRRACDHVLCIFPFEPDLLARHGVAATYVGHPLANVIPMEADKAAARVALGLPVDGEVVAILPGSRKSEIHALARRFLDAAALVRRSRPAVTWIVPALPALRPAIDAAVQAAGLAGVVKVLDGQSHLALAACDVTLIASGTATLEAALFKRPMVIAYAMNTISWHMMRRQQLQPWVGLPNILCEQFVVPELLQHDATPQALATSLLEWLDAPARMAAVQQTFTELHQRLRRDTATLATDAIQQVIEG
ncbi:MULTISPECIES: lipid-A-disaccharide synthase [Ramlibacter]|uniref:Lipid-A-disaccharide synthase n=1 Tax=Ramlibacter pinisoli TaxID=2682844 RepID=A0A6N8IWU4_9BURK|nr:MULTISPECIES: lipid-A-disaccharide synthase [Ramlibacter]MBA2961304.1 lipid-A-disaccharide synthase [Ramlibacter sp. CGMCC 1.13660]MVQ31248.1 lipid-A-disaccharide synthase [Ramlibacter pinisoli]